MDLDDFEEGLRKEVKQLTKTVRGISILIVILIIVLLLLLLPQAFWYLNHP
ncbi:MAG: hypothetical protein ACXAC5_16820 [Promethearchaeota archaeon]|jgi:hypothetical protein